MALERRKRDAMDSLSGVVPKGGLTPGSEAWNAYSMALSNSRSLPSIGLTNSRPNSPPVHQQHSTMTGGSTFTAQSGRSGRSGKSGKKTQSPSQRQQRQQQQQRGQPQQLNKPEYLRDAGPLTLNWAKGQLEQVRSICDRLVSSTGGMVDRRDIPPTSMEKPAMPCEESEEEALGSVTQPHLSSLT